MGRREVAKGKEFEREIAARFREHMPGCNARRGLSQSRCAEEGADVQVPFFHVECKRYACSPVAALEQALEDCSGDGGVSRALHPACSDHMWPLAITRANRQPAIAHMYLEDFLTLVAEWYELKLGAKSNDAETDQG